MILLGYWVSSDSKWPFYPLVGGHLTFPKGHLTIPKRSQRIARYKKLQNAGLDGEKLLSQAAPGIYSQG